MTRRDFSLSMSGVGLQATWSDAVWDLGARRELFVDREGIGEMRGTELRAGTPGDAGVALKLDRAWEGPFSGYSTVLRTEKGFRVYYRGLPQAGQDGSAGESTCCAESVDGVEWKRPELRLFPREGAALNNIVLAGEPPYAHNFTPFVDERPGVEDGARYKALAGIHKSGLAGFVSGDGLRWRKVQEDPVVPSPKEFAFDSQNIALWSAAEGRYVLYYRTWKLVNGVRYRWVSRAVSENFLAWRMEGEVDFGAAPPEHLYTNQTAAYFRAPQFYIGLAARFFPGRQVVTAEQAAVLKVDPRYYRDCSDAVLVSSRGGLRFERTFLEGFLRPGYGLENWVSRSNYPALNVIPAGKSKMSFFVNRNYGQPAAELRRYELRLDGFASLHAGYAGGEMTTRAFRFSGERLELNFSTSAAGFVKVEMQDEGGRPLPGYALADAPEAIGDEIDREYLWKGGARAAALHGRTVRMKVVLKDADLYSYRFAA